MKKVLIGLIALIAIFTLSCDKNPTVPEENPAELIKVGFSVKNYIMQVDNLKSTEDDPFSIVEHNSYGAGDIQLKSRKGEVVDVHFEADGLDTVKIMLPEGDWTLLESDYKIYSDDYPNNVFNYILNPTIYRYNLTTNLRERYSPLENEGWQTINTNSNIFVVDIVPKEVNCIAVYDTLDLLESIYVVNNPNNIITANDMYHYSNGVKVVYNHRLSDELMIVLTNGKEFIIDVEIIRYYCGTIADESGFVLMPRFIKIELLPDEENGSSLATYTNINVIEFGDTVSYKF